MVLLKGQMEGMDWKGVHLYKITDNTLALISGADAYYGTKILDVTQSTEIYVDERIHDIIVANCMEYGSSFIGRRDYSQKVLQSNRNLPIAIQPKKGMFFFPTSSIYKQGGIMLAYFQIEAYQKNGTLTKVVFTNQQVLYINVSFNKFDEQMKRTSRVIASYYQTIL